MGQITEAPSRALRAMATAFVRMVDGAKNRDSLERWAFAGGVVRATARTLLWLTLVVLIGTAAWSWTFAADTIEIVPFTGTGDESGTLGRAVADTLSYELHNIVSLHKGSKLWFRGGEPIRIFALGNAPVFERSTTLTAGGMQIPLGDILAAINRYWPHVHRQQMLAGAVNRFKTADGSLIQISARLEDGDATAAAWRVTGRIQNDDEIPPLVEDLAYQIVWELSGDIRTKSWTAFKHVSQGLLDFQKWNATNAADQFTASESEFQAAVKDDPTYVSARYYLGYLYYMADYYFWDRDQGRLLRSSITDDDGKRAMEQFSAIERLVQIWGRESDEAYAHLGRGVMNGDRYWDLVRQPGRAQADVDKRFKDAEDELRKAAEIDATLILPRLALGTLFEERAKHVPEGEMKSSLESAVSEFMLAAHVEGADDAARNDSIERADKLRAKLRQVR